MLDLAKPASLSDLLKIIADTTGTVTGSTKTI